MLLLVTASNALAEWREVGTDPTIATTTYADPSSIRRVGNVASLWHLYDLKFPQQLNGKQYRSLEQKREFDCKNRTTRSLEASVYEGNMGRGIRISTESGPNETRPVIPGTPIAYLLAIACTQ